MYNLKGFIAFPTLTNNDIGAVAEFGEISKDSLTFTKETGLYKSGQYPATLLYSFTSVDSEQGPINVPGQYQLLCLRLGRLVFEHSTMGRFNELTQTTRFDILEDMGSLITDLLVGPMVQMGSFWSPAWVSFKATSADTWFKLWFSDAYFSNEYDEYEFDFIAPIATLDDFFASPEQVTNELKKRTLSKLLELADQIRGEYPYTVLKTMEFDWVDPNNSETTISTNWTVLVYGRAGANEDTIRNYLADWILSQSNRPREDWVTIFPDIFAPREFIVTPLWSQYAIPNRTIQAGIHSPKIPIDKAIYVASLVCHGFGYSPESQKRNTTVTTIPYKSLGTLITGSSENRDGITLMEELFPDYVAVSMHVQDFARMSPYTQDWVKLINEMLKVAENYNSNLLPPPSYSRVIREDVVYLARYYDGRQFLMVTREAMANLINPNSPHYPGYPGEGEVEFPDLTDAEKLAMLNDHLAAINPHETNATHLGLGNLDDIDPALVYHGEIVAINVFYEYSL